MERGNTSSCRFRRASACAPVGASKTVRGMRGRAISQRRMVTSVLRGLYKSMERDNVLASGAEWKSRDVQWARAKSCPWDSSVYEVAVISRAKHVPKWAKDNECPWEGNRAISAKIRNPECCAGRGKTGRITLRMRCSSQKVPKESFQFILMYWLRRSCAPSATMRRFALAS